MKRRPLLLGTILTSTLLLLLSLGGCKDHATGEALAHHGETSSTVTALETPGPGIAPHQGQTHAPAHDEQQPEMTATTATTAPEPPNVESR